MERNGHTEATVDLMKLAGLKECGLCCEIMSDDGKMMRTDELISFAEKYNIPYITVKDLQEYRKVFDNLVQCVSITNMPTKYGEFKAHCYINKLNGRAPYCSCNGKYIRRRKRFMPCPFRMSYRRCFRIAQMRLRTAVG